MLKNLKTGLIYHNPVPHIKSSHAYFPSVTVMANGEMLATFVLGEAFEAVNLHTHIARSKDNGETWTHEGPIYQGTKERLTTDSARITCLPNGELVVLMARNDRTEHPGEGMTNPETLGFVPTEFILFRSSDFGHTWQGPEAMHSPFEDTPLELCSPITALKDGRCIIPTSPWKKWNGDNPHGNRMAALVSNDLCRSWPEYMDVMVDTNKELLFWESKIVELPDGRLCAVAWVYNHSDGRDLTNHYALSEDGGRNWTAPSSTELSGQTLTPFLLENGFLLCVYRRMDKPGLWANLSRFEGSRWINEDCEPLWGHQAHGLTGTSKNMAYNFSVLRFGAPCITRLHDGTIFVAFWAYEDCVSNIRWFKFQVIK